MKKMYSQQVKKLRAVTPNQIEDEEEEKIPD